MTRSPWNSQKALLEIRQRMNDLVKQSLQQFEMCPEVSARNTQWTPPFDVLETDTAIIVSGELPGLCKDDIKVQLEGSELIIRGERRPEVVDKATTYHLSERYYGGFVRSFRLPDQIEDSKISTSFKDGLLEIMLPKRKPRHIPIQ